MNPLTNIRNVQKLNEQELQLGIIGKKSWHDEYKDSAWLFIGGLPYDLSEGDVICVFSQYGEPVNFNLVRDHKTGKSKGFAFLCYNDQRSTVLAVDNLNGIKILGRTIRVDHVKEYKIPKEHKDDNDFVKKMREVGCAPTLESSSENEKEDIKTIPKKKKKEKKEKKRKKRKADSSDVSDSEMKLEPDRKKSNFFHQMDVKQEKFDDGYECDIKEKNRQRRNGKHKVDEDKRSRYRDSESENEHDGHSHIGRHRINKDNREEKYRDNFKYRHKDDDRYRDSYRSRDSDRKYDRHRDRDRYKN